MDLWRETSRILNTEAPVRAAAVRKPARSECPAKLSGGVAGGGGAGLHQPGDGAVGHRGRR